MTALAHPAAVPAAGEQPGLLAPPELAEWLLAQAEAWFGCEGEDKWYVLDAVRAKEPKLACTVQCAFAERDGEIPALWQAEIAEDRRRNERYLELMRELAVLSPDAHTVKGLQLAERYPPGWLRFQADIDIVLDEQPLLELGARLIDAGWEVCSLTRVRQSGQVETIVNLTRGSGESGRPLYLDLITADFLSVTGLRGIHRLTGSPDEQALLAVLAARRDRAFGLRDVLDAAVLCAAVAADDDAAGARRGAALRRGIEQHGLRAAAGVLVGLLAEYAPWAAADVLRDPPTGLRDRAVRRLPSLAEVRAGTRALDQAALARRAQRHLMGTAAASPRFGLLRTLANRTLTGYGERHFGADAGADGLVLWGIPIPDDASEALDARDLYRTPFGTWLLTPCVSLPHRLAVLTETDTDSDTDSDSDSDTDSAAEPAAASSMEDS